MVQASGALTERTNLEPITKGYFVHISRLLHSGLKMETHKELCPTLQRAHLLFSTPFLYTSPGKAKQRLNLQSTN